MNNHLHEAVEMLSFTYLRVEVLALFAATFCITCVSQLRSWFIFYANPFLIITNTFSLY